MPCLCSSMDVVDGKIENEYDFAEDAYEFEVALQESNVAVFTQPLSSPIKPGTHIVFKGTPTPELPWFYLELGISDSELIKTANLAVHFNPRLPQRYVVRNTKKNSRWGKEETASFRRFPFEFGRPFTIELMVGKHMMHFAVDGEHYCEYRIRDPAPFAANWVRVSGIKDAALVVGTADFYPTLAPPVPMMPVREGLTSGPTGTPTAPEPQWPRHCMALLPDCFGPDYEVVLQGKLRAIFHSFRVELSSAPHWYPHARVPLLAEVRAYLDPQCARQHVALNAWDGDWGAERRQKTARLVPGTEITMRIMRNETSWLVYINSQIVGEMEIRKFDCPIKVLRVRGDFYPEVMFICKVQSDQLVPSNNKSRKTSVRRVFNRFSRDATEPADNSLVDSTSSEPIHSVSETNGDTRSPSTANASLSSSKKELKRRKSQDKDGK